MHYQLSCSNSCLSSDSARVSPLHRLTLLAQLMFYSPQTPPSYSLMKRKTLFCVSGTRSQSGSEVMALPPVTPSDQGSRLQQHPGNHCSMWQSRISQCPQQGVKHLFGTAQLPTASFGVKHRVQNSACKEVQVVAWWVWVFLPPFTFDATNELRTEVPGMRREGWCLRAPRLGLRQPPGNRIACAGGSSPLPWELISQDLPRHRNWTQNKAILEERPMESSSRITLSG